jgi:hypothetical protein
MYMKLRFFLVCYIQEGGQNQTLLEQSCSTRSESFLVGATNTESFLVGATNMKSFGSGKPGPSFGNSKGFFMFSAANALSQHRIE